VLELQNLAGMKTGFGKTRSTADAWHLQNGLPHARRDRRPRRPEAGHALLMAAINDTSFDMDAAVFELTELVDRWCLGPSTASIVDAATDRRIPSIRLTDGNLVQLGHGAAQRRIWTAETDRTSAIAESIASDKDLTKTLLASCGVPVPEGSMVRSAEAAWEEAQDIGLPVAIKPVDANHGRGVSLNLMTEAEVHAAYAIASDEGDSHAVLVERFISGSEHRLLVVGSKVVAAARGESLWVTGDGASTLPRCATARSTSTRAAAKPKNSRSAPCCPPKAKKSCCELKRQGLTPASVPQPARKC
jgi:cyanophycin synthetase